MTDQLDFFEGDPLFGSRSLRDDRDLMWYPYFAMEKGRREPIDWRDDRVGLSIRLTGADYGIASLWDADILYCLRTMILQRINQGHAPTRSIIYTPHDVLRTMGEKTGKANYVRHMAALDRLKYTGIKSSMERYLDADAGLLHLNDATSWLDRYSVITKETTRGPISAGIKVTLSEWTFDMMSSPNRALAISPEIFQIKDAISRRIYSFAEKGSGTLGYFVMRVDRLRLQMNSQMEPRRFRFEIRRIVERNTLPKFTLELADTPPPTPVMNALSKRGLSEKGPYLIARPREGVVLKSKSGLIVPDNPIIY